MEQLRDEEVANRREAAIALGQIGTEARVANDLLIGQLRSPDLGVRGAAVYALGAISPEQLDQLDIGELDQWAENAKASSELSSGDRGATQATGQPDTFRPGNLPTACGWAPAQKDGRGEWLELSFERAVVPFSIHIHESYNPGFVVTVEAYDEANEAWITLWEGEEPESRAPATFSPTIAGEAVFPTDRIRIGVNTRVPGWNQIDAVRLVGRPVPVAK